MLQTFEAIIDEQGQVRPVEPIKTIPYKAIIDVPETALLSEAALAEDWNRPEEDEAWSSPTKAIKQKHQQSLRYDGEME